MRAVIWFTVLVILILVGGLVFVGGEELFHLFEQKRMSPRPIQEMNSQDVEKIDLPAPKKASSTSFEEVVAGRRSRRSFKSKELSLEHISQLLWVAQGITDKEKRYRAAPSAGALYPLELYLVVGGGGVENLGSGVYHYIPEAHSLEKLLADDLVSNLAQKCLGQNFIADAPVSLVITTDYSRVTGKYGERGRRYVHMEAGHAAQNVYLQGESLGLGTVTVGAFEDEEIIELLQLPSEHKPLYVMPIGYPK
ncbi:MAG: SagB/ThcOx family dehydrogenase [Patescibacteria group bacterium]